MPTDLPEKKTEEDEISITPGIFTNPVQWFLSIPVRTFLICFIAIMVPFGTILMALGLIFSDIKYKKKTKKLNNTN